MYEDVVNNMPNIQKLLSHKDRAKSLVERCFDR